MSRNPAPIPEPSIAERVRRSFEEVEALFARSDRHRDRLAQVPIRISVSGTRGKSTLTRWLHDELVARDYDTYAKITGTNPLSVYNGREWLIPRNAKTTLYENEREIGRFFPMDALVVENQGITPYTTRLVNTRYLDPTLVVMTNVREDHLDTLGGNRGRITRALARSVPDGAHVVCGEQGESIRSYIAQELDQRGATVTFVDIPPGYARIPGAELVYGLDEALRHVDGQGLDHARAREYLDLLRVEWTHLEDGRVFDASSVNDVQSTEAIRRALVGQEGEPIQPLVYLRRDRPGRTASYIRYLNLLADRGLVEQVRVVDGHSAAFDARTSMPVVVHAADEPPAAVLDAALDDDWPVVFMGNATPEFMVDLCAEVELLASDTTAPSTLDVVPRSLADVAGPGDQVLLLDNSGPDTDHGVCPGLLAAPDPDGVLWLTFDAAPDELHQRWLDHEESGSGPDQRFITVGATTRSAALGDRSSPPVDDQHGPDVAVDSIGEVGTAIDAVLETWEDGATVRVCVDGIDDLLDEKSLMWTFRFLHVLGQQLSTEGVSAHYHLSVAGYDQKTISTLTSLFDSVVTINDLGDWHQTD